MRFPPPEVDRLALDAPKCTCECGDPRCNNRRPEDRIDRLERLVSMLTTALSKTLEGCDSAGCVRIYGAEELVSKIEKELGQKNTWDFD